MAKDIKKPAPKKAAPKPVVIPPNPTRVYGATVFTVTSADKGKVADLIGKHGFRRVSEDAAGYRLQADAIAYASYKRGK